MLSTRYTIVIANRTTGVVRRFTIALRLAVGLVLGVLSIPILIGLGARWSSVAELQHLRAATDLLRHENTSFRAATGELAGQLSELQWAIDALSVQAQIDPATRRAMSRLPALVRSQARGGVQTAETRALLSATIRSPEDAFGTLKDLLGSLERHLSVVGVDLQQRTEIANATPSIWPALGWLTSGFGRRPDPFTGHPQSHYGIDISALGGDPVHATASGRVTTAGRNGDYGNLVVVEHAFGLSTRYAHLSRVLVSVGDEVKRGDLLGRVGATGRATSTHLHYEVWANGRPMNPMRLLAGQPR